MNSTKGTPRKVNCGAMAKVIKNIHPNGLSSEIDHGEFRFVCNLCQKRYTSASGLTYHIASFDHKNPPPNYDPYARTKRGRPKGFKLRDSLRLSRLSLQKHKSAESTPKMARRQSRATLGGHEHTVISNPTKKLTYEESQRLVEVEHQGVFHRISLDEPLEMTVDNTSSDPHICPTPKRNENVPQPEFTEQNVYDIDLKEIAPKLENQPYFHPLKDCHKYNVDDVEYQMDEEDFVWMSLIKSKPAFQKVTSENFEYIMDRIEKESEYIQKTTDGSVPKTIEEDVVCGVCLDGDCSNSNAIVFCDICNIAVHQDCYGVPFVPEGPWICRRCSHAPSKELECVLCPVKGGVLKQTINGSWCHMICAILVPGAKFTNAAFLDAIDISEISPTRFNVSCKLCAQTKGAVIQCYNHQCTLAFHASCAQINGLLAIERVETPTDDLNSTNQITHRYLAFCTKHLPSGQQVNTTTKNATTKIRIIQPIQHKSTFLPETIHVPMVSDNLLKNLDKNLQISHPQVFVSLVKRYWQIKRYMRSGVPILRRRSYVPRNLPSMTKLNISEVTQPQHFEPTLDKLRNLSTYIDEFITLLSNCRTREDLKHKHSIIQRSILNYLIDPHLLAHYLSLQIRDRVRSEDNIVFDTKKFMSLIYKRFEISFIHCLNNFKEFLLRILEEYSDSINLNGKKKEKFKELGDDIIDILSGKINRKRKSETFFNLSPDFEVVPSNSELPNMIKQLTENLKKKHTQKDFDHYLDSTSNNLTVWAKLDKVKYYPGVIISRTSSSAKRQKSSDFDVMFLDNKNTIRTIPRKFLVPLGLSASLDHSCLLNMVMSKLFNKHVKRSMLDSYIKARSMKESDLDNEEQDDEE